jgi:hypothetical protein
MYSSALMELLYADEYYKSAHMAPFNGETIHALYRQQSILTGPSAPFVISALPLYKGMRRCIIVEAVDAGFRSCMVPDSPYAGQLERQLQRPAAAFVTAYYGFQIT